MLTHEGILPTPAIPRGRLGLAPSADGDAREADAGDIEALIAPFARATGRVPGSRRISDQGNLIREKAHPARSACCSTSDAESSHPFCSRKVRKERVETRIVPCGGLFADRCQRHAGGLPEQDGIHPVDIPFGVASVAVVNDGRILYIDTVDIKTKLAILADAAKYDASCAASGGTRRDSSRAAGGKGGIGSHEGTGICHSFTPDGRCISLLKILLTNFCLYDCLYCINRRSSNVRRARFSVQEVVELTLDFYRRNCIDGLFLSSGVIRNPDYTMEQLVQVARTLRETHDFRGYIHLKTIPDASPELLSQAGRWADRLSVNIELPTQAGLDTLAPEKDGARIRDSMGLLRESIDAARAERRIIKAQPIRMLPGAKARRARAPSFAAGGQSTQMIVGADGASDAQILSTSAQLYGDYRLKRVYYSAFSPIPDAASALPAQSPPLLREHRLYQADWLMRFYGFSAHEITPTDSGMLALQVDPKLAWALAHPEHFPVDLNRAPRELLLRVPGLGVRTVQRLLAARRTRAIRADDLKALRVPTRRVLPFVLLADHRPAADAARRHGDAVLAAAQARQEPAPVQGTLF